MDASSVLADVKQAEVEPSEGSSKGLGQTLTLYKELFGKEEMLRVLPWLIQSGF